MKAVILILKHATSLRLSNQPPDLALNQVEQAYQEENMDWNIQQYLRALHQEPSVEQFLAFIMATNIGGFIIASAEIISHHSCTEFAHLHL